VVALPLPWGLGSCAWGRWWGLGPVPGQVGQGSGLQDLSKTYPKLIQNLSKTHNLSKHLPRTYPKTYPDTYPPEPPEIDLSGNLPRTYHQIQTYPKTYPETYPPEPPEIDLSGNLPRTYHKIQTYPETYPAPTDFDRLIQNLSENLSAILV